MSTFQVKEQTYQIELTFGEVRRLKNESLRFAEEIRELLSQKPFDLMAGMDQFELLVAHPELMLTVVWTLVYNQHPQFRKEMTVTEVQELEQDFANSLDGARIAEIDEALWEAIESFFPKKAKSISLWRQKIHEADEKIEKLLSERITPDVLENLLKGSLDMELEKLSERLGKPTV